MPFVIVHSYFYQQCAYVLQKCVGEWCEGVDPAGHFSLDYFNNNKNLTLFPPMDEKRFVSLKYPNESIFYYRINGFEYSVQLSMLYIILIVHLSKVKNKIEHTKSL